MVYMIGNKCRALNKDGSNCKHFAESATNEFTGDD